MPGCCPVDALHASTDGVCRAECRPASSRKLLAVLGCVSVQSASCPIYGNRVARASAARNDCFFFFFYNIDGSIELKIYA